MAKKPTTEKKVRTSYKERKEAKASATKTPYNWRKHLVPKNQSSNSTELVLIELDIWINRFPKALDYIKTNSGEITSEDIMYHLHLISRVLKHKCSVIPTI